MRSRTRRSPRLPLAPVSYRLPFSPVSWGGLLYSRQQNSPEEVRVEEARAAKEILVASSHPELNTCPAGSSRGGEGEGDDLAAEPADEERAGRAIAEGIAEGGIFH